MTEIPELVGQLLRAADDPYPIYRQMREIGRVVWVEGLDRWLVTGHREALTLLGHGGVSSDRRRYGPPEAEDRAHGFRPGGLPVVDPPEHTRLRTLVQQAFTPRAVERLRPRAEGLADELLTRAAERGEADVIADLAGPLPAILLAELLGIPSEDQETFQAWALEFIETIDPVSNRAVSDAGLRARDRMTEYLTGIITHRRRSPGEDLISGMVHAEQHGQRLTGEELLEMCLLLAIAGVETTTNLIGNAVSALLAHPDQLRRLSGEPALMRTAVEEFLRYDPPVQLAGRIAVEDIEVDGQTLRPGQVVGIVLGAANRDPAAFADPDGLDLTRSPNNHVAFSRGIHFCLGAPLARLQGRVALAALVTRFPTLYPAGEPKRRQNVHIRGFESFPVVLGAPRGGRR